MRYFGRHWKLLLRMFLDEHSRGNLRFQTSMKLVLKSCCFDDLNPPMKALFLCKKSSGFEDIILKIILHDIMRTRPVLLF